MTWTVDRHALRGKVAVVAGATRGAGRGIAAALGEAGATVICTGRSTRAARSDYDRPETIEDRFVGRAVAALLADSGQGALEPEVRQLRRARAQLWLHGPRRLSA